MNRDTTRLITFACGLALIVSTPATTVFARGGGGGGGGSGHSSSGMSHSGHTMSTPQNFSRSTSNFSPSNSHMSGSHMSNSHMTHPNFKNGVSKNGVTKNKFVSNKFQKQTMNKFASKSKSKYWRRYGWGFGGGLWGVDFGWGWGCWDSPWSYGWCWYDPLPVVDYYNPYCDCAGTVVDGVDYSHPIANLPANTVQGDDSDAFSAAREAFLEGNVDGALNSISVAALQMPQSQDMHQFHSLVLFAKGDYCKSATVAHAVLQEGPGWNWNTLQGFYPSPDIYTGQLRNLEHYVNDHPDEANARFLLAYHYLMMNHSDAGQRQMRQVVETQPKDRLAQNIVTGMTKSASAKLAVAKEESLTPVPDNNVPPGNNSADLETIVQARRAPANTMPVKSTPMVDDKTEKTNNDEDADTPPVTRKSAKAVGKGKAVVVDDTPAPVEEKPEKVTTDDDSDKTPVNDKSINAKPVIDKSAKVAGKNKADDDTPADDKSDKATTDDKADKTPADKSEPVTTKDKADKAPADDKAEKATDNDDEKTPANDKSDKAATKDKAENASTDEKSDKTTTDDDSDKPAVGDKREKSAGKGKAGKASTYEEEDQPPVQEKPRKAPGKRRKTVPAAEKPQLAVTDDSGNSVSDDPPARPARPKRTRPAKRVPAAGGFAGTFKASPEQGIVIQLTLGADQAFEWKFTANGKTQRFAGKYKMSANSLALTRNDGETMDGTLERTGNGGFKFRMKGAEADDPGLTFSR